MPVRCRAEFITAKINCLYMVTSILINILICIHHLIFIYDQFWASISNLHSEPVEIKVSRSSSTFQ